MGRWTITRQQFRRLAMLTTFGICVLVVAGGVVRLTGSGLGCEDWPNCNSERFVDVSSGHAAIEQVNRILSGLIGLPTLALAIGSFRVRPSTSGLRGPSIGVLVSVLANGVVGGMAVRGDLHPALVQSHFLLAMISIAFGMVAVNRAAEPRAERDAEPVGVLPGTRLATAGLAALTALALITGTVVTGTGPHAGEEDVRRFGFDISTVARLHSAVVLVSIGTALLLAWRLRDDAGGRRLLGNALSGWIFIGLVQGGIGYVQYFNGVPELLVGTHIAFATALWVVTVHLAHQGLRAGEAKHVTHISLREPSPA
jgi:cytochrome c oxidase assembly protein subunit 15